jgi:ribonuclease HI
MPSRPADLPFYAQADTPDNNFNTPLVEINLTTAVLTAKGVGGVKYGKWTAQLTFGDERKEISATDAHQTIGTRGALLAAVAGLGALKRRCSVQLYTDSEYLLSGATTWLPLGMALGWHTGPKAGRIRNHDLWGQLRDISARHSIDWIGPRRQADAEFADITPDLKTELWRRTVGEGQDKGYLYAGHESPWSESMGAYRAFAESEMRDPAICASVDCTDDSGVTTLTAKEKQARKKVIARIAKHYRPEHIRPAPRKPPDTIAAPPSTPLTLEPIKVKRIVAAFEELQPGTVSPTGAVSFLRYPRADARFRYPTARTARLELGLEQ